MSRLLSTTDLLVRAERLEVWDAEPDVAADSETVRADGRRRT
jgi:hypothetical protein